MVAFCQWHYSGDLLTVEYRTDPADRQSCSDGGEEPPDPVRSQYQECFVVSRPCPHLP